LGKNVRKPQGGGIFLTHTVGHFGGSVHSQSLDW